MKINNSTYIYLFIFGTLCKKNSVTKREKGEFDINLQPPAFVWLNIPFDNWLCLCACYNILSRKT